MKELIDRLKNKNYVRAFGLMKPEEQDVLESVGWMNRLVYIPKKWYPDGDKIKERERTHLTFCIKPGYQPEPEFVDYLIEICEDANCEPGTFLGVKEKLDNSPILPHDHTYLYCLPSLPNFVHFFAATKNCNDKQIILSEHVAGYIYSGKKVYARFRTGGGN